MEGGLQKGTTTVLMSGGIDSTACADFLAKQGNSVQGVLVDFGQAAGACERRAAHALATQMHIPLTTYSISGGSPYSAGEVLGRNAFLIFAALFLTRQKNGLLAIGIHAGSPYYDCSPPFFSIMTQLIAEHTDGRVTLVAPFLDWSKRDVFHYFLSSGLSIDLTYSCEAGTEPPCGACASCRDRKALGC
jgi:7-cyano-7-deazaguanine synthase